MAGAVRMGGERLGEREERKEEDGRREEDEKIREDGRGGKGSCVSPVPSPSFR